MYIYRINPNRMGLYIDRSSKKTGAQNRLLHALEIELSSK